MGERNVYVYIFLMWFATYLLRVVPLTLIRKPLKNRFIRSSSWELSRAVHAADAFFAPQRERT